MEDAREQSAERPAGRLRIPCFVAGYRLAVWRCTIENRRQVLRFLEIGRK